MADCPQLAYRLAHRGVRYEQQGADRATYGTQLLTELARQLRDVKGLAERRLYQCREFYRAYPTILQTVSAKSQFADLLPANLLPKAPQPTGLLASDASPGVAPELLLSRLSFSHFIELLKLDTPLQRAFYEVQAVRNNWSVRELKRAIDTLLYERTGLSTDKQTVLADHAGTQPLTAADVVKNPMCWSFWDLSSAPATAKTTSKRPSLSTCRLF